MTGWSLVTFSLGFDFDENLSNIFNKAICCLTCRPNREELFKVLGVVYLHFQLVWGSDFSEDFWWWYWDGSNMGYSRKKWKRLGHTFSKKKLEIFRFVFLPLQVPNKKKFHPWKFCKMVLQPLEIPRPKTKTHGNSTCFLDHPWKFYFFNQHLEFPHAISTIPLEIPCPQQPKFGFFWSSPIGRYSY